MPGVILACGDEAKVALSKAVPGVILVPADCKAMLKQQPSSGVNLFLMCNSVDGICG